MKIERLPSTRLAVKIVLAYALLGSLWILLSDRLLEQLLDVPHVATDLQTLKGWSFVFVTSLGLYAIVRRGTRSLQHSYTLLQTILNGTNDAIFAKDLNGRYLVANLASAEVLDRSIETILGADDLELFGEDVGRMLRENDRRTLQKGSTQIFEEIIETGDRTRIYLATKDVWYDARGVPIGIIGVSREVTQTYQAQQALSESEHRYRTLFECHPQPMWVYDLEELRFLAVNQAAIAHYEYSEEEFLSMRVTDLYPPEDLPRLLANVPAPNSGYDDAGIWRHLTKSGREIGVRMTAHTLQFDGRAAEVVLASDVTEQLKAEAKLERYAYTDTVTDLPNRRSLLRSLQAAIARQRQHPDRSFALLYLSLDGFARLKFSLGHDIAHQVLREAAHRLQASLPHATVARVGDSELAVLVGESPQRLPQLTDRLQQDLAHAYLIDRREVYSTNSIGIVLSQIDYDSPEDYLQAGDAAMHQAKQTAAPKCVTFTRQLQEMALRRLELDSALRRALERREFCLYYQPIVDLARQQLLGFEALVRWQHPQRGLVPPGEFVPLAEETGSIVSLGEWVLGEACWQLRDWQLRFGKPELTMSVNVAAAQLMQPTFLNLVDAVLSDTQVSPRCLKLEITETTLVKNTQQISRSLAELERRGLALSIDDFGTGYSSLSYLHSFPFRVLKLDRSFVMQLETNAKSLAVVRNVAMLAQTLNLSVVAEGIETEAQLRQLQQLGFHAGQGYWFAPPLPADRAVQWLQGEL